MRLFHRHSSFVVCNALLALGTTLSFSSLRDTSAAVQVWDNVLTDDTIGLLHKEASLSGLSHKVFRIGSHCSENILEKNLDEIVRQLYFRENDDKEEEGEHKYVEYWCRQEWRHIEAHADVDENLAKSENSLRYPNKGHVLYLRIGTDVQGPTCLFNVTSGGELVAQSSSGEGGVNLVTVPAVQGRLLQFDGKLLHAVPRPVDLWLLPFVKGASNFVPEEQFGRSVILFNTWSQPPKEIPLSSTATEEGRCSTSTNGSNSVNPGPSMKCNSKSLWESIDIVGQDDNSCDANGGRDDYRTKSTKIWLLGDENRRDYLYRTVKLVSTGMFKYSNDTQ